jgi:AraC family transcriptional regulator
MLHFEHPFLAEMMVHLRYLVLHPADYTLMYMEAFATIMIEEIIRFQKNASLSSNSVPFRRVNNLGRLAGWQKRAVCDYIEENLHRDISVSDLASVAGLSKFHFCRSFKESLGEPPHRYHISRRLERATLLLQDRTLSVPEVAAAVGYGSSSQFSAAFTKRFGRSPRRFRCI